MQLVKSGGATEFQIPDLPYPMDALEPVLSRETLEYHYGAHHLGYVEKLNGLVAGTRLEHATLEQIVRTSTGAVYNNAAQVWNHDFYWDCMAPQGGRGAPAGDLATRLASTFGSFESFKEVFKRHAVQKFGSGWTWLVKKADGSVDIVNMGAAGTPLTTADKALFTVDVWEHAYYIDHRNLRPKFVETYLNSLANWDFAEANFA